MKKIIYLEDAIDVIKKHYRICDDLLEVISYEDLFEVIAHEIERLPSAEPAYQRMPDACRACSNHPQNGGSGICHCTLGQIPIT